MFCTYVFVYIAHVCAWLKRGGKEGEEGCWFVYVTGLGSFLFRLSASVLHTCIFMYTYLLLEKAASHLDNHRNLLH